MSDPRNEMPMTVKFWLAELFLPAPNIIFPKRMPARSKQDLFDVYHSLEDGIENCSRKEQKRRIKWMLKLEISMRVREVVE